MKAMKSRLILASAAAVAVSLTISACSTATPTGSASPSNLDNESSTSSLAAIKKSGILKVAAPQAIPPYLFLGSDGKDQGIEFDLINELAKELGLKAEISHFPFPGLIPALQSGRVDIAMGNFSDTAARQKEVDFVDYDLGVIGFLVPAGNPGNIKNVSDLCGVTVAVPTGNLSAQIVKNQGVKCEADSKPSPSIVEYPTPADAQLQIANRRADVMLLDYVQGSWVADQSQSKMEMSGQPICPSLHGAALLKDQKDLRDALVGAFKNMQKSGKYDAILGKWTKYGADAMALKTVVINGATDTSFTEAQPPANLKDICP